MNGNSCDSEAAACPEGQPLQGDLGPKLKGKTKKNRRLPSRFELCASDIHDHGWQRTESTPPSTPTPSPTPSPTSSFRRKFVFTVPGIMRPKQPREYKLKAFVMAMCFAMILMISLTYVHHQQYLLRIQQVMIGERIRFDEKSRAVHVMNAAKEVVLIGDLGRGLPEDMQPYDCPLTTANENVTLCLNWYMMANLAISPFMEDKQAPLTKCYKIEWQALEEDIILEDCYHVENAHWFGVGETNPQHLNFEELSINYTNFQTANLTTGTFGTVLERYWLSSKGVVIMIDPHLPLQIRQTGGTNAPQLCFKSDISTSYPYLEPSVNSDRVNHHLPYLTYSICSSSDIRTVHIHTSSKMKSRVNTTNHFSFTLENIVWATRQRYGDSVNKSLLSKFADDVLDYDPNHPGILLLERGWQSNEGDLSFDTTKFPDLQNWLRIMHHKGFRVVLGVHPYVSTQSSNYHKFLDEGWWIRDITGRVPSLTYWDNLSSVVMVDFTNPKAARWFGGMLRSVRSKYNVDGLQFCGGESSSIPPYHTTKEPLMSQDRYATLYNDVAAKTSIMFSTCIATQGLSSPGFIQLSPRRSSWDSAIGLQSLIPAVLSVGLAGHPFLLTGPVGGEVKNNSQLLPDKELFIRWMEISTFFPVLQFSVLPSDYDTETNDIAKEYITLRRTVVVPLLKTLIDEATGNRTPLIRPVWWLSPNDTESMTVNQQFLLGDHLMVVGVVQQGAQECDVFMPPGMWRDTSGVLHKGGKWIYGFPAKLGKVVYFTRVEHYM